MRWLVRFVHNIPPTDLLEVELRLTAKNVYGNCVDDVPVDAKPVGRPPILHSNISPGLAPTMVGVPDSVLNALPDFCSNRKLSMSWS